MDTSPQLDILLYAHDGRGLGHASRTIAIGIALRRLFPSLKVLFVSGCRLSQELIGPAPLDWLKLPSYETTVVNGKSRGTRGNSNFEDDELGSLRSTQLKHITQLYRPRLILADHSPQGKHKELRPSLESEAAEDIIWVLGMRGVIGQVGQVSSELASSLFKRYYHSLLWYGDSAILGKTQLQMISDHYAAAPYECGYVSRLSEIKRYSRLSPSAPVSGTVSVPWIGEKTPEFLMNLHSILSRRSTTERWHVFLDSTHKDSARFFDLFARTENCRIEKPSHRYLDSLLASQCAIVYGGYNSLVDVLSLGLPSLVVEREMRDNEQRQHLQELVRFGCSLSVLKEDSPSNELEEHINQVLHQPHGSAPSPVNLNGASIAARKLASLVQTD